MYSGLQRNVTPGFLNALPFIDPSGAVVYEPAAQEALRQWFSGEIPWWNHYEGVGFPLAGNVQPGVFSLYLPLLLLPKGVILQQVIGQVLCGLLTYRALRFIGCSRFAAVVAGALYELNGTFAWLGSIWSMPMVALPLWICGIELVRIGGRRIWIGMACIAVATYVAITSSFVETGFLEGLLSAGWAIARLPALRASSAFRFFAFCAAGGVIGVLLAGPQIVAFAGAVKFAYSAHSDGAIGYRGIITEGIPQIFLPYVWGPIFRYTSANLALLWGNVGGYAGIGTLVVASAAFGVRRSRPLVGVLVGWIALTIGAEFGAPLMSQLINLIPGVKFTAQYRYSPPSWEFALVVLCAILITEWQSDGVSFFRPAHRIALAALAVTLAGFVYLHSATVDELLTQPHYRAWLLFSLLSGVVVAAVAAACMRRHGLKSLRVLGIVLIGEALLYYVLPTLSYPRSGFVDTGYLRAIHGAGDSRLYSMGALQPNFGAFYQVPQINFNDAMIPKAYGDFLAQLDPYNVGPEWFLPYRLGPSAGFPTLAENFAWHRRGFESLAVKYVDVAPDLLLPSFAPVVQAIQGKFALAGAKLVGEFGGMLDGDDITGIRFSVIGAGAPDGIVRATLCSDRKCTSADVALDGRASPDKVLELKFAKSLPIGNGRISFAIAQRRFHRPAQLWLYASGSSDEAVVGRPGFFPKLLVETRLTPFVVPIGPATSQSLELQRANVVATIPTPDVDGSIVSISVLDAKHGGTVRLRLCSKRCVFGESTRPRSSPDGYVQIRLMKPLKIDQKSVKAEFSEGDRKRTDSLALFAQAPQFPQQLVYGGRSIIGFAPKVRFAVASQPPVEVYRSASTSLVELPSSQPYFSAGNCKLNSSSRDLVVAQCRERSTLVRRELYYPGWSVTVNGANALIRPQHQILEEVPLPKGESTVRFHYEPRYARAALIFVALGFLLLAACIMLGLRSALPVRSVLAT